MGCFPLKRQIDIVQKPITNDHLIVNSDDVKISGALFLKEHGDKDPLDYYNIIKKIGEGGYSKVFKVSGFQLI